MDVHVQGHICSYYDLLGLLREKAKTNTDINSLRVVRERFNALEAKAESFFNSSLKETDDKSAIAELRSEYSKFSSQCLELNLVLSHLITTNENLSPPSPQNTQVNTIANHSLLHSLPKIHIDSFNGKGDFELFLSKFNTLIHENATLPDVSKFHFLISLLEGEPLKLISAYPINADGYASALNLLTNKYQNKRALINDCLDKILDIPPIVANASSLQNFLDIYLTSAQTLKCYDVDLEAGNAELLVRLLLRKLDKALRLRFEQGLDGTFPKLKELIEFVKNQLNVYRNSELPKSNVTITGTKRNISSFHASLDANKLMCKVCQGEHKIYSCPLFLSLNSKQRHERVKVLKLCFNCLSKHFNQKCNSSNTCAKCHKRHHSLLHFDEPNFIQNSNVNKIPQSSKLNGHFSSLASGSREPPSLNSSCVTPASNSQFPHKSQNSSWQPNMSLVCDQNKSTVLLATVRVKLFSSQHNYIIVRGLLDSASQVSFVTERCAKILSAFSPQPCQKLNGVSGIPVKPLGYAKLGISDLDGNFLKDEQEFMVLHKISGDLPSAPISPSIRELVAQYPLADLEFDIPSKIDVLLGADITANILETKIASLGQNMPALYKTCLGHVLMGPAPTLGNSSSEVSGLVTCHVSEDKNIENLIKKFSEIEQPPPLAPPKDDLLCEEIYLNTTTRNSDGRYQVQSPNRSNSSPLKNSSRIPRKSLTYKDNHFAKNSSCFSKNPRYSSKYKKFKDKHLRVGHSVPANSSLSSALSLFKNKPLRAGHLVPANPSPHSDLPLFKNKYLCAGNSVPTKISPRSDLPLFKNKYLRAGNSMPANITPPHASPLRLINNEHRYKGPEWLSLTRKHWPVDCPDPVFSKSDYSQELRSAELESLAVTSVSQSFPHDFSSWISLIRVTAWMLRFVYNSRKPQPQRNLSSNLSISEIMLAQRKICKLVQLESFPHILNSLLAGKNIPKQYAALNPFVDSEGLVRIGGRLSHSTLASNSKNSILLPKKHHVVSLIINYYHLKYFHARSHLLQSLLASTFWIISFRQSIRSTLSKCVLCFKAAPRNKPPFMGDLPEGRVIPSPPFSRTGCDFAGPFIIRSSSLRQSKKLKCYFVVFVCFATKAMHIEVVTDMTTNAFLAALSRFIARRGMITHLHCDCGTNLVGASNSLNRTFRELLKGDTQDLPRYGVENQIFFHFNCPAHPSSGGLWEAAVKSIKRHLAISLNSYVPTLEEFNTLLIRIEALLNSRPLTPLSNDPSDIDVLTPAHFLIGRSLRVPPDEAQLINKPPFKCRWLHIQHIFNGLWKRWSKEYLHTLQLRQKWLQRPSNLKVGDLVYVNDLNLPPLQWPLGRIIEVYPGDDNVVRIVTVRTSRGDYKRPATRLFPLPLFSVDTGDVQGAGSA